jgi:hypothetical protein
MVEKQEKKKEISGGRGYLSFLSFRVSSGGMSLIALIEEKKKTDLYCCFLRYNKILNELHRKLIDQLNSLRI